MESFGDGRNLCVRDLVAATTILTENWRYEAVIGRTSLLGLLWQTGMAVDTRSGPTAYMYVCLDIFTHTSAPGCQNGTEMLRHHENFQALYRLNFPSLVPGVLNLDLRNAAPSRHPDTPTT